MLSNDQIFRTLREIAIIKNHSFDLEELRHVEINKRTYSANEFDEYKRDLIEAGNKLRILLLEYELTNEGFQTFLKDKPGLLLAFLEKEGQTFPVLLIPEKAKWKALVIGTEHNELFDSMDNLSLFRNRKGDIHFYAIFTYDTPLGRAEEGHSISPMRRLIQLLRTERKEIIYILFYAILVGLVSLILPLGIQTTVELVSGGVVFSSVYLMIGLVILGVILAGILQITQISLVEYLQRRIFTKAAFELAFRIPRLRLEAIFKNYAPELVNRFFDVMTIQKGLPKLLIDLSSSAIQIVFGLLLISLYHPFFVFFGLILLSTLVLIFYLTGPRALSTSILESKYKYKVAQWLEELARAIHSFKLAGSTDMPLRKTDYNVNNYLKNRKAHFNILVTQYSFILIFKALIVGGLLVMGTLLVIDRQITLGQFVASEVVIILILGAVEKIVMYMDVVYDLLTAVDKVAHVTDLPIEKTGGFDLPKNKGGLAVRMKNVTYHYADSAEPALSGIDLEIPSRQILALAGSSNSGKSTLADVLCGFFIDYEGVVTFNGFSLRDLDLTHLRDKVATNAMQEDIFDGTLLENITLGSSTLTVEDAVSAIEAVRLNDAINQLPDGLSTSILSGGKGFSRDFIQRLILARAVAKKPQLLILNNFFSFFSKKDELELLKYLTAKERSWTLVLITNDPAIMECCERVLVMEAGKIKTDGPWETVRNNASMKELIY